MPLNLDAIITLQGLHTSALDFGDAQFALGVSDTIRLLNGTGAGQIDRLFTDTRTLGPAATENLDVNAGGLLDAFGAVFTLARLKGIYVKAAAGNTNKVQVTRPAANGVPLFLAASDGFELSPGGASLLVWPDVTGIVVTAGTGDLITVTNGGGVTPVTYNIALFGASV